MCQVTMDVSVVIPTFDRRDSVLRLVDGLRTQTLDHSRFEVIVSVDGSTDGTRDALQMLAVPFRLRILWQDNAGRARATNTGIEAAEGAVIVILDDDMEPTPTLLSAHLDAHRDGERLAVLGPVPVVVTEGAPLQGYIARRFDEHLRKCASPDHRFGVRDFYSGNASFRRADIVQAGMFDSAFAEYGNEDLELAVRLRSSGVEIGFAPDASARQHYEKQFEALARDTVSKGRTAVQFGTKHPEVVHELEYGRPDHRSRAWRSGRSIVGWLTRRRLGWNALVAGTTCLERTRLRRLDTWYALVLDACYFEGVRLAHEQRS